VYLEIDSNNKSSLIRKIRWNRTDELVHVRFLDLINNRVEASTLNYIPVTPLDKFLEACRGNGVTKLAEVKTLYFAYNGITDESLAGILYLLHNYHQTVEPSCKKLCLLSFTDNKITSDGFRSLLLILRILNNVTIGHLLMDYNYIQVQDTEEEGNSCFLSEFADVLEQIDLLDLSDIFLEKKFKSLAHFQIASIVIYSHEDLTNALTSGELQSVSPVCCSQTSTSGVHTESGWVGVFEVRPVFGNGILNSPEDVSNTDPNRLPFRLAKVDMALSMAAYFGW